MAAPKLKTARIRVPKPAVRLYAPKIKPPKASIDPEARELIAERDRLLEKFTVMQADLGGAFYEMAIRDHVKLDVLTRKAAELQRLDVELGELEETIEALGPQSTGACSQCGTEFDPGAKFCSNCGAELAEA
jgi:hypothetical protein